MDIAGLFLVENYIMKDVRGIFVKTYHAEMFKEIGFTNSFKESYYSQSQQNVIRGMHFQLPPHDHEKLVYVAQGKILDVVLDVQIESPSFGRSVSVELNAFGSSLLIPKGCAHGFLTLSETAIVVYNVSTVYNKDADKGILWNSFHFDWKIENPILSERDRTFPPFNNLTSLL